LAFTVTLQPSGHEYTAESGQSLLQAGLSAGLFMPYSCRSGVCRTCLGVVREGKVDYGAVHPTYLPDSDKAKGCALLCQATPLSDLVIELRELEGMAGVVPGKIPCRVVRIEKPVPDVALVDLKLPMNENMMFIPGQHIDLLFDDGRRRSYSIACSPQAEGISRVELHIRHTPGGYFTDKLFGGEVQDRKVMRFEGPLGTFSLREKSDRPIVFVASGTGFAPIKAMLEHAFRRGFRRTMTLYWGCRTKRDLYMLDLPQKWAAEHAHFTYVPVLSEPLPEDEWSGRTGFVHRAVMEDFPDLSRHQVYACGAPVMVDAARADFIGKCGLPADEFYADAFLTEAERNMA
jgi:CDP-4-dehydro-6-deoxyglucose reductase